MFLTNQFKLTTQPGPNPRLHYAEGGAVLCSCFCKTIDITVWLILIGPCCIIVFIVILIYKCSKDLLQINT